MNRRAFFKILATAAPAALAFPQIVRSSTLGLGGGIAPSNRLNFGLIGAGGIGAVLFDAMNAFKFRDVSAIVVVVVIAVTLIDMLSQAMRKRLL